LASGASSNSQRLVLSANLQGVGQEQARDTTSKAALKEKF
jgi:hypothetical protein